MTLEEEIKHKVIEAKRLKALSKRRGNLEQASTAHKEASAIRAELNQHYTSLKHRKLPAPQKTYVYFLTNPSFNAVKIGFTTRAIVDRMTELNRSTSLPTEFALVGYIIDQNAKELERRIHKHLTKWRTNPRREFFDISFEEAVSIIESKFAIRVIRKDNAK
jgi:hypothetical protein